MTTGIYVIANKVNGHIYVGSSVNIESRWSTHISSLIKNKHGNKYLQRAWNKYGKQNFSFSICITCSKDYLLYYEQQFLDQWKPEYNISPTAGNSLGVKHSKKFCDDISIRLIGHTVSDETRRKIIFSNKGKHNGDKHPNFGKHLPQEVKDKIGLANSKIPRTKEWIEKMRKSKTGVPTPRKIFDGFVSPDGVEYKNIFNLKEFCMKHGVGYVSMCRLHRGERNHHKGWRKIK